MTRLGLGLALALAACGSNAKPIDAFYSKCGQPTDTGNELGIGKFCELNSDCSATAPLCSIYGDKTTHFCTKTCQGDAGVDQCGTATQCVCETGGATCGCTPTACL